MTRRSQRTPTRRPPSRGAVLISVLVLLLLYLYQSGALDRWLEPPGSGQLPPTAPAGGEPPTPGQQPGAIQAFFTTPSLVYPDRAKQRGPSPLLQAVITDIDAARASIDMAVFDLDVAEVTEALLRAKQRGLTVRLIVDSENLETPEVADQTGRLQKASIPITFDEREPFMHNKFIVLDNAITWTGSWNITYNDTFRNNNNMLRFVNGEISADYAREFEQMFGGRFGPRKQSGSPYPAVQISTAHIDVHFSPEDGVANYVLEQLQAAQKSIHFMTFSFTSDPIGDAMIAKARAGLNVQGVFEAQNAEGSGAEYKKLVSGGIDVLEDGSCYIMHHKVIIVDERIVITGSYNFTASAENNNDENLLVINDPALAQRYLEEFSRVYQQAQSPTRCG